MAKHSIPLPNIMSKLFDIWKDGPVIHRAWVDGENLVLDLRGPMIPDVESVRLERADRCPVIFVPAAAYESAVEQGRPYALRAIRGEVRRP